MPKRDRLSLLTSLLSLLVYGAGLIGLAQLLSSECFLRGVSLAVLVSGVGAIASLGLVTTVLTLTRKHSVPSSSRERYLVGRRGVLRSILSQNW